MSTDNTLDEYKSIITRQKVLFTVVRYFLFDGFKGFFHLQKHLELLKALKPFRKANLISYRTYAIYLFSYISRSLTTEDKRQILNHHYSFLRSIFPENKLGPLFKEGIECYRENHEDETYIVTLNFSGLLEFEGSLSLFFIVNNVKVFTLSFTFAPGKIFGSADETIVFISCLQGVKNQFDNISRATKYFQDIIPPVILLKVIESIAVALDIKTIMGVSAQNQLSFGNEMDYENFYANYDEFWKNIGGKEGKGNYTISCPFPQKPILLIKQNHRNRTIRKRRKLSEVYINSYNNVLQLLILPMFDSIACCVASSISMAEMSMR